MKPNFTSVSLVLLTLVCLSLVACGVQPAAPAATSGEESDLPVSADSEEE